MVDSKHSAHMATVFRTVKSSEHARRTLQPINDMADNMKPSRSTKTNLRLSIGDPTVDGNLKISENATKSLVAVVSSEEYNGYPPTSGYQDTKEVVAQYCSRLCPTTSLETNYFDWNNVIMTSGVSHGIVLAISALCNEGDNILVGAPAFPHYKTVCDSYGVECRFYPLNPASKWESDLTVAEHLVDANTKALVIINPSNPCGSNFSRSHVEELVHFCERHQLPIISDEIYAELVLHGGVFTSVADIPSAVPRMLLGGTAKYQVNPGWRLGWAMLVDPTNAASEWLTGMKQLAQLLAGPNSLAQVSLAQTLLDTPVTSTRAIIGQLEAGAMCYNRLLEHDIGISFDPPSAAMFVMLHIDYSYYKDISSDTEFYEKLLDEENVQVLPGTIFGVHGFVRATISRPTAILNEAIDRITEFCERHRK